jgi:hypothetical protein
MAHKRLPLLSLSFRLEALRQRWRRFWLRQLGVRVEADAVIHRGVDCRLGLAQGRRGRIQIGPSKYSVAWVKRSATHGFNRLRGSRKLDTTLLTRQWRQIIYSRG